MSSLACPLPLQGHPVITLAHGAGGRAMHALIDRVFAAAFEMASPADRHDGFTFAASSTRLAVTTDATVVTPRIFPGGTLGRLAVAGALNDLAMCGARAQHIAVAFILEEGLTLEELWCHVCDMAALSKQHNAKVVTGDTKVVPRGQGDGLYVATTAVGAVSHRRCLAPRCVLPGDAILLSGDVGRHGLAILAARENLGLEPPPESDLCVVAPPAITLAESDIDVRWMRDPTRGGIASALNELAQAAELRIEVDELLVPVAPAVNAACELLGLDPWQSACEGRFVAVVPETQAARALALLRSFPESADAVYIGRVTGHHARGEVVARTPYGTHRVVDMLHGAALPRIC